MKNRLINKKLSGLLLGIGIIALTNCTGNHINDAAQPSNAGSGDVNVAVMVGKIGELAKRTSIDMEKLIVEIKVKDSSNAVVNDTSALSGYGEAVIKKTFPSLTAPEIFVLFAKTLDKTGKVIHSGSVEFSTIPADTVDVALDLAAMYSMLKVAFNDIPDSVSKVRLAIAAIDTLDSTFTRGTRDTAIFRHDYLPADKNGISHAISLKAMGSFYGKDTVLFAADTTIFAKAGIDTNYKVVLKWVGPGVPKGAASMTVNIGSVGTTLVNAGFGEMNVGIPVDGLVAYYPFNGDAKDMSGNGNDGVIGGSSLSADRFNRLNASFQFDGINDSIVVADNNSLHFSSSFSISCWVKASQTAAYSAIIEKYDYSEVSNHFGFDIAIGPGSFNGSRPYSFRADISNGDYITRQSTVKDTINAEDNLWHHVTVVFTNDSTFLHVDASIRSSAQSFGIHSTTRPIIIGKDHYNSSRWFNGLIDDIRIYNRALTASEISALYHENGWTGN